MPLNSKPVSTTSSNRHGPDSTLPASPEHHLIVTTARGVYAWSSRGTVQLFSSTSNGIVATTNVQTNKDVLAIADSQIVVLHDLGEGMQSTYRLKKEEHGQLRKLYYHPVRERLFFTTTLQNAVQTFSFEKSELLDAAPVHASPPTAFAVSPACDLLVSASADPPTIYLSRIAYNQPPLLFIPNCSNAPVVAIAFHPTRSRIFVLAFQDGTIAAYDASILPTSHTTEERYSYARIYGEISHVLRLHEPIAVSSVSSDTKSGNFLPTIRGVQFLADQPCSVVSIGSDGKCCVLDFEKNGVKACEVIEQWQLSAPGSSLAILKSKHQIGPTQIDGNDDEHESVDTNPVLLAVGKDNGTVSIYNKTGTLLASRNFGKDDRILDLEWMERLKGPARKQQDTGYKLSIKSEAASPTLNRPASFPNLPTSPPISSQNSRSSVGSKIMVKLHTKELPPENYLLQKQHIIGDIAEEPNDRQAPALDGNSSAIKQNVELEDNVDKDETKKPDQIGQQKQFDSTSNSFHTPPEAKTSSRRLSQGTTSSQGSRKRETRSKIPVIPPRPVPRPGGRLALRRMESAKSRRSSSYRWPVPKEVVRAVTTGQPQFKMINHIVPVRPRASRNRSSRISPLTEVSEPHSTTYTSNYPFRPATTVQSSSLRSETAPVQYDRLNKVSWDAGSSASTSQSSMFAAPRRRPEVPTTTKLSNSAVMRLGGVRPIKANKVESTAIVPAYTSDSGTSFGSVLDWTPAQAYRPTHVPQDIKLRQVSVPPKSSLPGAWVPEDRLPSSKIEGQPDSDVSSASQLDWHVSGVPTNQPSTQPIDASHQTKDPILGSHQVDRTLKHAAGIQDPPPLYSPKLRKQETVINLKEKRKQSDEAQTDKSASIVIPVDPPKLPQDPRLSDPGPITKGSNNAETPISPAPGSKFPSISLSAPPGSTSPITRRSSHMGAMLDLPQVRSGSTVGSQSTYTIEDVIRIECTAICTRLELAFEEQRAWLQGFMREQNWYGQRLEEENRQFRDELARLRKA